MRIDGPQVIQLVNQEDAQSNELHFNFTLQFQHENIATQTNLIQVYIWKLKKSATQPQLSEPDMQGINIILNFCEQILSHINNGEITLSEAIIIEIKPEYSVFNFLKQQVKYLRVTAYANR